MHPASEEEKGIIPRILDYVFKKHKHTLDKLTVKVSYTEIYNDHIIDLLEDKTPLEAEWPGFVASDKA